MVVSAPSVSKVNCYLINNLLLISKRCCSKFLNANGWVTHHIEHNEATGRDCRAAELVFGPEKKIAMRKTLRGGLYVSAGYISTVFFDRFTQRREESLEFILARHGREYKYLYASILPLLLSFVLSFTTAKGRNDEWLSLFSLLAPRSQHMSPRIR